MNFIQIANDILNHKIIFLPNRNRGYRIYEIEIYNCNNKRKDTNDEEFHSLQPENNTFYLHRLSEATSSLRKECLNYVTEGNIGILIRAIVDVRTGKTYTNSRISINELFSNYGNDMTSTLFSETYNINDEFKLIPYALNIMKLK